MWKGFANRLRLDLHAWTIPALLFIARGNQTRPKLCRFQNVNVVICRECSHQNKKSQQKKCTEWIGLAFRFSFSSELMQIEGQKTVRVRGSDPWKQDHGDIGYLKAITMNCNKFCMPILQRTHSDRLEIVIPNKTTTTADHSPDRTTTINSKKRTTADQSSAI